MKRCGSRLLFLVPALLVFVAACQDSSQLTDPAAGLSPESGPTHSSGTATAAMPKPIQITTLGGSDPAISGDRIVWQDHRSGAEIFMLDLTTGTEEQITSFLAGSPAISGSNIVYKFSGLMTFNSTVKSGSSVNNELAISGDRVVWDTPIVADGPMPDIVLYDLGTDVETNISNHPASQSQGAISGSRIVWMDNRAADGNLDIYMFDVATSTETQITTNPASQSKPAISGDRIVWADKRFGEPAQIFMYDVVAMTETQITSTADVSSGVGIDGDRIVWADSRASDGNDDIYMFDLGTMTETRITRSRADQNSPAISGDRIVWQEFPTKGGPSNIFMLELAGASPLVGQVQGIAADVQALLDAGQILPAAAAELIGDLEAAIKKLGNNRDAAAAKALSQFTNTAGTLELDGQISSVNADALIASARAAIVAITDAAGRTFVCHIRKEGVSAGEPLWTGRVIFTPNDDVPLHCSPHGKFNVTDHNPVIGNLGVNNACGRLKIFVAPTCEVGEIGGSP